MTWQREQKSESAAWLSTNGRPAPQEVVVVDDRLTADEALRLASQGTAMLWEGDFQNARQLLAAIDRRLMKRSQRKKPQPSTQDATAFYRLRQARAQRSRIMSLVLVRVARDPVSDAPEVQLPRAPGLSGALEFGYGSVPGFARGQCVVSLQELIGVMGAHQWYLRGIEVPSLGAKIHPHYGTFLPTRHEYVDLVAQAPLPALDLAFDIGTGTGVLAAVLARRGIARVVATDIHQRSVDCANDNFSRLGLTGAATAQLTSMFPKGKAALIVCNPPWLPGNATTSLDAAIYDPGSKMLLQFLAGLPAHLTEHGEGWLVLSDLAEHLGLRSRQLLLDAIEQAGLKVIERLDTSPSHKRAKDQDDPLFEARSREVTSLWRLRVT